MTDRPIKVSGYDPAILTYCQRLKYSIRSTGDPLSDINGSSGNSPTGPES